METTHVINGKVRYLSLRNPYLTRDGKCAKCGIAYLKCSCIINDSEIIGWYQELSKEFDVVIPMIEREECGE